MSATAAEREQQRLGALAQYQVMDSASEQAFDDITALASLWLEMPIALISLVDDHRQWFKSRVGLDALETPRDLAFCAHAIAQGHLMEVPDARQDSRFSHNPLVTDAPFIRFYAGMPISTPQGHLLGTLCVIDNKPRQLDAVQRETLERLTRMVEYQLELRLALIHSAERERELREQRALAEGVLDNIHAGVVVCNEAGELTIFNNTARDWHGLDVLKIPPEQWALYYDLYRADGTTPLPPNEIPLLRAWQGEQVENAEICLQAQGQAPRILLCNGGPLERQTRQSSAIVVMHDITELRQATQLKSQFLATVSHELRTPLTSLSGAISLLRGGTCGELPAAAQRLLQIAHDNGLRLNELINDLLDLEKLEAGKLPLLCSNQPLRPLLEQVLEANRLYAQRYKVSLRLQEPCANPEVYVDPRRLLQVLSNYLSNAAKFSHEHGEVIVECEQLTDQVEVRVIDQGIGIDSAQIGNLFQKFTQLDVGDTRQRGGTGLGLVICKELIERMQGEVGVSSTLGQGATFWFRLPLTSGTEPQ
ncbi:Signal transduction histidine kinase [Halopseudomonas sabulinigri]|uniref:histidine kinase n=1 Tax=Halopseudomonas sabulinigri TaxID=472181 RepID=A0A1H1TTJ1_9GAMM|nr:ATP-binding protein [Halopseudomonas sabulinigri]SDS63411.1 Signal transduction histidine kinase [Halopseudomonas sabulinigri]